MVICILGRQPALGLAELESRFGAAALRPFGQRAAWLDVEPANILINQFGGVMRVAVPIATYDGTDWPQLLQAAHRYVPRLLQNMPMGKLKLGLSIYGIDANLKALQRGGLELKKAVRDSGRSVRLVPNTASELNSAQVLRNRLTGELGLELVFIRDGRQTQLARTIAVQDIDRYAKRDFGRPRRDAFVGMLPPKLAQTMLNLARAHAGTRVLDPFCGTGVILQEAALLGCSVYGSDANERMVRYTRDNLNWLRSTYHIEFDEYLEVADATTATWRPPIGAVVSETYLGRPLTSLPSPHQLEAIIQDCNDTTGQFLRNLRPQLRAGTHLCIAVPAWRDRQQFIHLPIVDYLKEMGYNRINFSFASHEELIYHRTDQIVGRELLAITVKE